MSSGVSDRYKRQAAAVSSGKPMDERDAIPWSQQVDEELLYENLSYTENKSGYSSAAASVQFQNPPFIIRPDNCPNQKHKKTYPYESKNKCCQPPCDCTDSKRTDDSNSDKKVKSYNTKKDNFSFSQKMLSRETQQKMVFCDTPVGTNEDHKLADEGSSMTNESNKKKITWASIASQPAKPNKRNNNISLKKKGPGMPPPPMIPGKHSLDINTWDFAASSNIATPETSESIPISIPISESVTPLEVDLSAKPKPHTAPEQMSNFGRKQVNAYSKKPIKHVKTNNPRPVESVSRDRRYIQKHNEEPNQNMKPQPQQHQQHQPIASCASNYKKESFDGEPVERSIVPGGGGSGVTGVAIGAESAETLQPKTADVSHVVLKQLKDRNNYNPPQIDLQTAALSRFFVIKSYSEDDIHRSIKYEIWCSTDHGNKRLDEAFKERVKEGGNVMLFFSVNGSGHFCGMAQMMTSVDYNSTSSVWSQDKWKGKFKVRWIYVKDVPNSQLRHIRLENNENKSVTNSRDTQEVPIGKGLQVLKILHLYKHQTSIFDDFYHYEKKQEESVLKKPTDNYAHSSSSMNVEQQQQNNDRYGGQQQQQQHFRDRIISHRGGNGSGSGHIGGGGSGGGGHHNFFPNRRYGKNIVENQPNKDDKEKSIGFISQDRENNETVKHNLQRYTNPSVDNCSSKRNNTEIILHVTNFNCNENNIVRKNAETK